MSDSIETSLDECSFIMREHYWQQKDLTNAVRVAQTGIALGLVSAEKHPESAHETLSKVKGLYYDVASFTWPGWDEAGIVPTDAEQSMGMEAARENLRFAVELGKGDLPTARAHWMVGAHLLTTGFSDEARGEFEAAQTFAEQAGARAEAMLAEGFAMLAAGLSADLDEHLKRMDADEEAKELAGQIRTASGVLSRES